MSYDRNLISIHIFTNLSISICICMYICVLYIYNVYIYTWTMHDEWKMLLTNDEWRMKNDSTYHVLRRITNNKPQVHICCTGSKTRGYRLLYICGSYNAQRKSWITGTSTWLTTTFEPHTWIANTTWYIRLPSKFRVA